VAPNSTGCSAKTRPRDFGAPSRQKDIVVDVSTESLIAMHSARFSLLGSVAEVSIGSLKVSGVFPSDTLSRELERLRDGSLLSRREPCLLVAEWY
jgi:hypothetical protein